MRRRAQLAGLPPEVIHDRGVTLRRVLADLPEPLLGALIGGLKRHGDDLRCGRLFHSEHESCAAGAMIRELHPQDFEGGHIHFLVHHRWRRSAASYGGGLARGMHALMLESTFDRAVYVARKTYPRIDEREASRHVGRWFLTEAERERQNRELRVAAGLPPVINWREERLRTWGEGMGRRLASSLPKPPKLRLLGFRLDAEGLPGVGRLRPAEHRGPLAVA